MLDIKTIKKIDELFDKINDFEVRFGESVVWLYVEDRYLTLFNDGCYSGEKYIYCHFLSRVIEAINKKFAFDENGYFVSQDGDGCDVARWRGADPFFFSLDCYGSWEECKEDTIKYIIDNIGDNNG